MRQNVILFEANKLGVHVQLSDFRYIRNIWQHINPCIKNKCAVVMWPSEAMSICS